MAKNGKPTKVQEFIWRSPVLEGNDRVQSTENRQYLADHLGLSFDERDFIVGLHSNRRPRCLQDQGRYRYVSFGPFR